MKLSALLKGLAPAYNTADPAADVTAVVADSRRVEPGCVFVCIHGGQVDGHDFAQQALEGGAVAVVTNHRLGLDREIVVDDTRHAYALLCAGINGNPAESMTLVGVTGTNGKTTVTHVLWHILTSCGHKTGLIGTIHNYIGDKTVPAHYTTPEPGELHALLRDMKAAGCTHVVMEASSHALAQQRLDGLTFELGVFTNLTQDHLDYHGTMEAYYSAKRRLFEQSRAAVVNLDDPIAPRLIGDIDGDVITYSADRDDADYTAKGIESKASGVRFTMVGHSKIGRVQFVIPGLYSVGNAMAAVAAAVRLGVEFDDAVAALNTSTGVTGRMEVLPTGTDYTVIRDYAHSPDGLQQVLSALREFKEGRLIALFGCGGNRDRDKRPKMGAAVAQLADFAVVTSDNPRHEDPVAIINDILPGIEGSDCPYIVIPDRREAIAWALQNAQPHDIIVLLGKGHEDYQVLDTGTIDFDEKQVVAQLLQERQ